MSREANQALIFEIEEKNREIERLKNILREKSDKLSVVSVSYDNTADKVFVRENELKSKNTEISSLKDKLAEV